MPLPFRLQQCLVNDESSGFAADSGTFGTTIPFNSATVTLEHTRIPDEGMRERLPIQNDSNIGIKTATLDLNVNLCGHFTTTVGAVSATWLHTLLGDGLGGKSTQAGASAGYGTTTAGAAIYSLGTDNGLTETDGAIIRVGAKGDGRADGQATVLDGASGDLHVALPAVGVTGDHLYGSLMQYHSEGASLTTKRFLVMNATTGAQYRLLGGQLAGLSLSLPVDNSIPTLNLSYQFAYWNRTATTFPDTGNTIGRHEAAPLAGGSFAFSDVNATASSRTRTTVTPAEINLTMDLGLQPVLGPGGANTYQNITAWSRTNAKTSLEFKIPWENTYQTWWETDNNSVTPKNIMFTGNTVDGRAVGFYCPRVKPAGNVPSQVMEVNEQNYVNVSVICDEDTDSDSELTRSAVRFFMA